MLTGKILQENSTVHIGCYPSNFPLRSIYCEKDGARHLGFYWATPRSLNGGLTVGAFDYTNASLAKPSADSFKVMLIQEDKDLSRYVYVIVPEDYTISDFTEACCTGCEAIPDVTVPEPIFNTSICIPGDVVCPPCVNETLVPVAAFTGDNNTYTAVATCTDEDGEVVTMSPANVTGASIAALATAAQTAWATELGGGTFTVQGNNIRVVSPACKTFTLTITQSEV